MFGLLIADDDVDSRARLAKMLIDEGYDVVVTDRASHVIEGILKDMARVVILGGQVDGLRASDLLPVLKRCKSDVKVIIASGEESLPALRKLRKEGIFYHFVKPIRVEDSDEVRQVVQCAFGNIRSLPRHPEGVAGP